MNQTKASQAYWRATRKLTALVLVLWCAVSFGTGILFADLLNHFSLAGYPLGFWFAQQGSIIAFVLLVFFYAQQMDRLDQAHDEQAP